MSRRVCVSIVRQLSYIAGIFQQYGRFVQLGVSVSVLNPSQGNQGLLMEIDAGTVNRTMEARASAARGDPSSM